MLGVFPEDVRTIAENDGAWPAEAELVRIWSSTTAGGDDLLRISDEDFGAPSGVPVRSGDLVKIVSTLAGLGYGWSAGPIA